MNMMDMLQKTGGLDSIARELNIDQGAAKMGAEALMPAILGGFKKNAQAQGGMGSLMGVIGQLGGGGLLSNVLGPATTDVSQGNNVLGEIFGSKEVSRTVAGNASVQTGIDFGLLKKMLPMLAMLVAGYMSNQAASKTGENGAGSGIGGILGGLLGGSKGSSLGGLANMIDMDGDGNPLDDIIGMASKFSR